MAQSQIRGDGSWGRFAGMTKVRAVVVIVPLLVAVPFAAGVTLFEENEQVESVGAPEQVRETAEEKLLRDVTVAVKLAVPPAATVPWAGLNAIEKSGCAAAEPVPERATVCGLPESLSATCNEADSADVVEGLKVTETVQFAPEANVAPHVVVLAKSAAFVPVNEMAILLMVEPVALVTVTACAELVVFSVTVPKDSEVGKANTPCAAAGDILATKPLPWVPVPFCTV